MDSKIYKLSIFSLLDSIGAATFIIDKNNTVVYWNQACESLTGLSSEEVINTNQHWRGFYSSERLCLADVVLLDNKEDYSQYYSNIEKAKCSKHGYISFNWCDTPAGLKYLAFEANALFDEEENIIGAIETLRDISELKQAEISQSKLALKHKKLFELTKVDFYNTNEAFKAYLTESTKQLGVNRASVWKYNDDRTKIISLYSLYDNVFDTQEVSLEIKDHLNYINNLEVESYLVVDDVRDDALVSDIADYLSANNIVSLLDVPIVIDGKVQFILCHENTGTIKEWTSEDKDFVRSVGDIIGNKLISIENKENENKLKYYAAHDALTGLLNRYSFEKEIKSIINQTEENNTSNIVFFMDLDQFKVINDTCGHKAGDELIKSISQVLKTSTRNNDVLARLGGDEFGIVLKNCPEDKAIVIADKIVRNISDYKFIWDKKIFKVGISIGITGFSQYSESVEEVMSKADTACYVAKDKGRNRFHLYESTNEEATEKRKEMRLISNIQKALDEKTFELHLQSISCLKSNKVSHYEVLTRMRDEKNELVSPGKFIPCAERYNLMCKIDMLIIQKSFDFLNKMYAYNNKTDINISINISGQSISDESFLIFLSDLISRNKHIAQNISFELTETAAVSNTIVANHFIDTISNLGCNFALDDFGSGVSSYGYLKHLPFDTLKIDGIFVKDITTDEISQAVIRSINEVSHILGMTTVAEYVENDETKQLLKDMGVDYAQGYGIDKPFPAENLFDLMVKKDKSNKAIAEVSL